MKIALMTDLEGCAGLVNCEDWIYPESRYYEQAKELLTREANAAIEGFSEAGATEITVIDGHGPGGINTLLLDGRARYSRGWAVTHQFGLNESFDAIAWVGQHAKAGSEFAHLCHTGSMDLIDVRINGVSVGEFGEIAAIAGFYGVPAIFGSGDRAFTREAKQLIPQIHTVEVKRGVMPGRGDECSTEEYEKRNGGAVHLSPSSARALIRSGAGEALTDFVRNRGKFSPLVFRPPFIRESWYRTGKNSRPHREILRHDTDIVAMYASKAEVIR